MNEIEVVVDVKRSSDTGEWVVVKQKLEAADQLHPVGSPTETKLVVSTNRKVQLAATFIRDSHLGQTVGVDAVNVSSSPIEIGRVAFECEIPPLFDSASWGFVSDLGTGFGHGLMLVPNSARSGLVYPGESRSYVFPPAMLDTARMVIASLSPGKFWVAAYIGCEEIGRLAGERLNHYLDSDTGISIHRRAQPVFDSMPELDRLRLLMRVAPLRSIYSKDWPKQKVNELPEKPGIFVVHVTTEIMALVTQSNLKGVEILDIVQRSMLDQLFKPKNEVGNVA